MRFLDYIHHVKPNYREDWFHGYMIELLERAVREGLDVLCSAPPGFGKTELFGILFPSWLISEDPAVHIISLANSDGLSRMAAGNILRIIQSPAFQELCPLELDKATEQQFLVAGNDGRPTLHAAGINGQLTGHRAKYIVYDDLTKSLADAYSPTVRERVWNNFNSCAETRLLPNGHVYGIQTRWALDDTHGRLLRRAGESPDARQFLYLSLAAVNNGSQSFLFTTANQKMEYLPAYRSLATVRGQPYSFTPQAIRGKRADLGPTVFSALYMQNPVASENQMFPPEVWGSVDSVVVDDYGLIVSAWDTASRDKATNDPSANVVLGRRHTGDFVVLDAVEMRLTFDKLLPVVLERYRKLSTQFRGLPLLCVEEASSGQQLLDIVRSQFPNLPYVAAKPVKSKIVRAEGVTPFTMARSVALLKADWNADFVACMANFPADSRDHYCDAFTHGMKCFVGTGSDFYKPEFLLTPGSSDPELEEYIDSLPAFGCIAPDLYSLD